MGKQHMLIIKDTAKYTKQKNGAITRNKKSNNLIILIA